MDSNQIKGNWEQLKGKVKEKWGELTDDDLKKIDGKKDQLIGKLQAKYGYTKEVAEQQYEDFENTSNQ
jgi:uncharacterized protein YjbJ (UPF0337 family)